MLLSMVVPKISHLKHLITLSLFYVLVLKRGSFKGTSCLVVVLHGRGKILAEGKIL